MSGSEGEPGWRRAFDSVERRIGAPLEGATGSETFVELIVQGVKIQRAATGAVGRVVGGGLAKALHLAGLPTRRDVSRLSKQLTTLTAEVRTLKPAQRIGSPRPRGARAAAAKGEDEDPS
jgi:hypothetical protein